MDQDDTQRFHYGAADFLGWALKSGWRPKTLPVGVVYTFQGAVARDIEADTSRFVENADLTVSNARTFLTADDGTPVMLACLNPGAASMATQLDHLRFLAGPAQLAAVIVGTAGAIAGPHAIGDIVVVDSAIATDGVSRAYLPGEELVTADPDLSERLRSLLGDPPVARSWTVAVPYRSTRADVESARAAGAEVVEMEIAALMAVGHALDIATAAAVVVSDVSQVDEPTTVDWSDTGAPTRRALDAAIEAIRTSRSA